MGGSSRPTYWSPRRLLSDDQMNQYLRDKLRDYNNRDVDAINRHIRGLGSALGQTDDDVIYTRFGGSVRRHTYVNGLSDVDLLLIVNDSSLAGLTPNEIIRRMAGRIRQRMPTTNVTEGNLAVTIRYADGHEIQVLPAIRTPNGVRIANPSNGSWSGVLHPERFIQKLTQVNQARNGQVIPTIKLAKVLADRHVQSDRDKITGYHMESLAIEAFKNYQGPTNLKSMLLHLIDYSSNAVGQPIRDTTGQSRYVDDYLGPPGSPQRQKATATFRIMPEAVLAIARSTLTDLGKFEL